MSNQLDQVIYTAHTHITGGRDGAGRSSDGAIDVLLSTPGSGRRGTNPEQLFGIGYAGCFIVAMETAGRQRGLDNRITHMTSLQLRPAMGGHRPPVARRSTLRWLGAAITFAFYASTPIPSLAHATGSGDANPRLIASAAQDTAIRPFRAHVPAADVAELRRRLMATRWPDKETVADASQGAQLARLQELVRYWATDYDWRKGEAKLNAFPQYTTKIDGVDIHFIHVKSRHPNAMPLIVTHGWPGSVFEQIKLIEPLTDPTRFGGRAEDAFDVVIPSLPGYGFSSHPTDVGWNVDRIGNAWDVLMKRLGYTRYAAQGGDWGAGVVEAMARQAPRGLVGIHTNLPAVFPPDAAAAIASGAPAPNGLSNQEQAAFDDVKRFIGSGGWGYYQMMTARPQAVGYGLTDSPAGLAGWMLVHGGFGKWSFGSDARQHPTKDEVLDNLSLHWLTNSVASGARLYWENREVNLISADAQKTQDIKVPVAITVFPEDDLFRAPESWARRAFPSLTYFNTVDRGGHFAAWEHPELFANEVRAAFKTLR